MSIYANININSTCTRTKTKNTQKMRLYFPNIVAYPSVYAYLSDYDHVWCSVLVYGG